MRASMVNKLKRLNQGIMVELRIYSNNTLHVVLSMNDPNTWRTHVIKGIKVNKKFAQYMINNLDRLQYGYVEKGFIFGAFTKKQLTQLLTQHGLTYRQPTGAKW
jgi:hypothetical protein